MITSLQNDKVKLAHGLQNRPRTRRKERKIALEGTRLLRDAVERGHKALFVLYDPASADYELVALLQEHDIQLLEVNAEVIAHVSDTQNPQGMVGVFPLPVPPLPKTPARLLILDNVRDPGNLGTLLRTATAAGVQAVLLSPGCADPYNPKALRSGMGAHFRLPVVEANWVDIAAYCESLAIYLTDGGGDLRYDRVDWTSRWALVISNEASGLSAEAAHLSEQRVFIPMAAQTESLNAAMAAAVILFEAARQRSVGDAPA